MQKYMKNIDSLHVLFFIFHLLIHILQPTTNNDKGACHQTRPFRFVRIGRLELPLREELDPKSSAATNYAISA